MVGLENIFYKQLKVSSIAFLVTLYMFMVTVIGNKFNKNHVSYFRALLIKTALQNYFVNKAHFNLVLL